MCCYAKGRQCAGVRDGSDEEGDSGCDGDIIGRGVDLREMLAAECGYVFVSVFVVSVVSAVLPVLVVLVVSLVLNGVCHLMVLLSGAGVVSMVAAVAGVDEIGDVAGNGDVVG